MASENLFHFTDDNFDKTVASGVSLIDLYADWCGPCKILGPTIEKLADQFAGKVTVGKLNIDENPEVAGKLGISSVPTVLIFKDGAEVQRFVGVRSESDFTRALSKL